MRARFAAACLTGLLGLLGLLGMLGLPGCGEAEPLEVVELGEVCGQSGPVRMLELPPGRQLQISGYSFRSGDRRYFRTSPGGGAKDVQVWSTGLCGEAPRLLATDPRWISPRGDRWPGVVIACHGDSDELVALDPPGETTTVLMPGAGCDDDWTEHGVVAVVGDEDADAEFGALVLHPYPEDPYAAAPAPRMLHSQVRLRTAVDVYPYGRMPLRSLPDEVFAVDATDSLIRIDLADGTTTVEATDVHSFQVSDDGRYLLWQAMIASAREPVSPVILQDRSSGTRVALGELSLVSNPPPFEYLDHGLISLAADGYNPFRVFRLPGLDMVAVDGAYGLQEVVDARRWLLDSTDGLILLDPETGVRTVLLDSNAELLAVTPERAFVLDRDYRARKLMITVRELPFDGSGARVVAQGMNDHVRMIDERRLAYVAEPHDRLLGPLRVIDLPSGREQPVDEQVQVALPRGDAGFGPGHVVYSVDDGARSGVYVARLPEP